MSDQPLVSVIVPIYRVEKYLQECVNSICEQTYRNIEIILVDDGSPDRCGWMCDDYAKQDNRIKVIHKKNGGLSDARNAGMDIAHGEYICFVDSDDYIHREMVSIFVDHALRYDADIVCAGTQPFMDGTIPPPVVTGGSVRILNRLSAMQQFVVKDWGAWGKLYRREIHEGILFPCGKIHEDEAIMLHLLDRCDKIACVDDRLYYYRGREGSITAQAYSIRKMDWMEAWIKNVSFTQQSYPTIYEPCLSKAVTVALYNIGHLLGSEDNEQRVSVIVDFIRNHFKTITRCRYISVNAKIRVIVLMMSNVKKKTCLYHRLYGGLARLRGHANG